MRIERGVSNSEKSSLNPLNNSSMNTDNYSIFFWEILQYNNEMFG
jgi:hypothetical protein